MKDIIRNRARCKICGDVVESVHRYDFRACCCGNLPVDGGRDYIRRTHREGAESYEELSEIAEYKWDDGFVFNDGHAWFMGVDLLHCDRTDTGETVTLSIKLPYVKTPVPVDCRIYSIDTRLFAPNPPVKRIHDYYATEPKAVELILEQEDFCPKIWEPACGEGHMAKVLHKHGFTVRSTDLIDRGYGTGGIDFLKVEEQWDGDIITNPPYKFAQEFIEKALDLVEPGHKVAMFLKIQFLEGKSRRILFDSTPPKAVYVSSGRLKCAMNGDFERYAKSNAICYAWYVWQKSHYGPTELRWIN